MSSNNYAIEFFQGPLIAPSDVEALEHGVKEVAGKSFDELLELTHRDAAYQRAASGIIDYRDLIPDDDPQKREKVEYLEEVASIAVL